MLFAIASFLGDFHIHKKYDKLIVPLVSTGTFIIFIC